MAISIADKLAALRKARKTAKDGESDEVQEVQNDGFWFVHDDVFIAHLRNAGRDDIEFLMNRPVGERVAILQAIELNNNIVMKFLDYDN